MKKKIQPLAFILTLFALFSVVVMPRMPWPPEASAQSSGSDERFATCSKSISTTAVIASAITGKSIVVKAMILRSDTAGVVAFQDGSGGTTIANVYLAANQTLTLTPDMFGGALKTTSGTGLYAVLSSATLTACVRFVAE